ncbi:tRNA threonylcarbamoyladenosine dehydratase [Aureococcus anophagefferens]|uniref:tRNA threonylcarbamoyladenosine dehydratase n=1 Tax=Aureococcus anophagefferens TaxID=44056 RepID=A0ABR1FZZ7_AURAN
MSKSMSAKTSLIFAAGAVAGVAAWKALERHLRQRLYAERFAAGPRPPPRLRRLTKVVLGGASNPTTVAGDATAAAPRASLPADVVHEMLSRHEAFFGRWPRPRPRATAVVFGLGGVGSHCAVMLARAGVAALRLVDFDHVSLSSLNRHAVATRRRREPAKAPGPRDHAAKVAPFVAALSAMGAGAKADPTKLCVAPLADAVHDPLAVKLRWKLRQRGVDHGAELEPGPLARRARRSA